MDLLLNSWTPALKMKLIFDTLQELLLNPNPTDALESDISSEMIHEYDLYKQKAVAKALEKANQPIEVLMSDILGELASKESEHYKTTQKEIE